MNNTRITYSSKLNLPTFVCDSAETEEEEEEEEEEEATCLACVPYPPCALLCGIACPTMSVSPPLWQLLPLSVYSRAQRT
jgi:hypothetical protein